MVTKSVVTEYIKFRHRLGVEALSLTETWGVLVTWSLPEGMDTGWAGSPDQADHRDAGRDGSDSQGDFSGKLSPGGGILSAFLSMTSMFRIWGWNATEHSRASHSGQKFLRLQNPSSPGALAGTTPRLPRWLGTHLLPALSPGGLYGGHEEPPNSEE